MRASEIQPKKLVVFDIDDTLVYTQTKIHVLKDGQVVNSLNSHDFTHYKLKPGESFDFGDFSNAKEFFDNSKPNIPMMNQLKRDINTGNKVVMVTARSDFDDKELFLDTFRKFGVDIDRVHVYRAGNNKQGSTEERKKQIIKTLLDKDDYNKAIMYDDAKPNLHTFIELKKDHPKTRFYAWHVSPKGDAAEYMREDVVAEKKKRKKPRWAAYGPGPYGGYGYASGYSGAVGGDGGAGGGVGESTEDEAWELIGQPVPEIQKFVKGMGLGNDEESVAKIVPIIDLIPKTKIPAASIANLKNLANKPGEDKILAQIVGISGRPDAAKQYSKIMQARDAAEGRKRDYDVSNLTKALQSGNYEPPVLLKLPTGTYVIGGRTRLYAALALGINANVKVISADNFNVKENFADGKKPGRKGLAKRSGVNTKASVSSLRKTAKNSSGEKQRMAHWLANMKAGRAKKNK